MLYKTDNIEEKRIGSLKPHSRFSVGKKFAKEAQSIFLKSGWISVNITEEKILAEKKSAKETFSSTNTSAQ